MRVYPAYGRTIATHIYRGEKPICVAVMLSTRWGYFDHVPKICIRPDEWAPGRYQFGYLAGLHPVAVPGDGASDRQLAELLVEIMVAGPARLWAFNADGSKLYDGMWSSDISWWARELIVKAGEAERLPWGAIKAAEQVMARAQERAARQWCAEFKRVQQRGDVEAAARWAQATEYGIPDRVRALFASPWQAPGDARAA